MKPNGISVENFCCFVELLIFWVLFNFLGFVYVGFRFVKKISLEHSFVIFSPQITSKQNTATTFIDAISGRVKNDSSGDFR